MRDILIARRALLALAAGLAAGIWPIGPIWAQPPGRGDPHRSPRHLRVVALDPGHGGVDPGAISPHGIYEKNITLPTARLLARQLYLTGRYRTVLTRRGDTYVSLRERVARARAAHAELFLSIDADRLPDSAMRGLAVYTLSTRPPTAMPRPSPGARTGTISSPACVCRISRARSARSCSTWRAGRPTTGR